MALFVRLVLFVFFPMLVMSQQGRTENPRKPISVGPGKAFSVPSQAAAIVKDGDIVDISAGTYAGDVAVWRANDLTLRGVGGRPHLKAGGANAQGKAIWVIQGNNTVVENIEFSEARVPDGNGAAIRQEGRILTIRNCYIHDNQMGILGGVPDSEVLIEGSEFSGSSGPYNHNIYLGGRRLTLQFSYVHYAIHGHNVKTRARENFILYNRISDENTGTSSYAIDIPNGGRSYIIGNVIQKGPRSENSSVIAYGEEGATNEFQELYFVNNTVVSNFGKGLFLNIYGSPRVVSVINNVFAGRGVTLPKSVSATHNLISPDPFFKDPALFDYRLRSGSPAIDAGVQPGTANNFELVPRFQYVHHAGHKPRTEIGPLDLGAYEYDEK
jgi:hypothetical protein